MRDSNIESLKNIFHIFYTSSSHIYLKDLDGKFLACNPSKTQSLGAAADDCVIGKTDFDFCSYNDAFAIKSSDIEAMESHASISVEESYTILGDKKIFTSCKTPVRSVSGDLEGIFVISTDVLSPTKDLEEDLLMYITHEIKTPLSCMLKMSNLLYDNWDKYNDNQSRKEHLRMAVEGNNRLQNVLMNILDISKIKSGQMGYEMEVYSLKDSVLDVANEFIDDRSRINIEYKSDSNFYSVCDHYRIEQVIRNLLANSIIYGGTGNINISLEANESGHIIVSISDEGVGIPDKETESIFQIFNQSSRTKDNKNGSGIGLAICKNIISAHNGEIWVFNNSNGSGCTFSFSLKGLDASKEILQPKNVIKKPNSKMIGSRPTILLIDNEHSILEITSLVLESIGFNVMSAHSGEEGMYILQKEISNIDLVLLDLIMPDIDGLDLLEKIRQNELVKDIPVCIHSSNISDKYSIDRANALGVKCFVDKTLTAEKIAVLLSEFLVEG